MGTAPKPGGYNYRQQLNRARQANTRARDYVRRLLEERPGPQLAALYLAGLAVALGDNDNAILELEQIGKTLCEHGE